MSNVLNASEIIDFAVYIEQNGYKFYIETMKKFKDNRVMELFQYLADEELGHEKIFKNLLKKVGSFTPHESYPGEYEAYMKDFLKIHALGNAEALKNKIASIQSVDDAVNVALEFEKDSIVLFTLVKKYIGTKGDDIVDKIIQEELTHIYKINQFYRDLKNPQPIDA
jgi:rubrerythrin